MFLTYNVAMRMLECLFTNETMNDWGTGSKWVEYPQTHTMPEHRYLFRKITCNIYLETQLTET